MWWFIDWWASLQARASQSSAGLESRIGLVTTLVVGVRPRNPDSQVWCGPKNVDFCQGPWRCRSSHGTTCWEPQLWDVVLFLGICSESIRLPLGNFLGDTGLAVNHWRSYGERGLGAVSLGCRFSLQPLHRVLLCLQWFPSYPNLESGVTLFRAWTASLRLRQWQSNCLGGEQTSTSCLGPLLTHLQRWCLWRHWTSSVNIDDSVSSGVRRSSSTYVLKILLVNILQIVM